MNSSIPGALTAPPFFPPRPDPCLSCPLSAWDSELVAQQPVGAVQPALAR